VDAYIPVRVLPVTITWFSRFTNIRHILYTYTWKSFLFDIVRECTTRSRNSSLNESIGNAHALLPLVNSFSLIQHALSTFLDRCSGRTYESSRHVRGYTRSPEKISRHVLSDGNRPHACGADPFNVTESDAIHGGVISIHHI